MVGGGGEVVVGGIDFGMNGLVLARYPSGFFVLYVVRVGFGWIQKVYLILG